MNTKLIVRVSVLAGALLVAALLGYVSIQGTTAQAASNTLVGAWTVAVTPEGGPPFTDAMIFSSDGTVTVMEYVGRLGVGVWEKVSGRRYAFTVWEYYEEGDSFFQEKISSTIELSKDQEQFSGPFTVRGFSPQGNLLYEASGTATGVRMHVK